MKCIKLTSLSLSNFKGIRELTVYFNHITNISGDNGTGKSTIFDAFIWVLFGKNSNDQADFNIKTLDSDGNAIPKIPHEVTCTLDVNGQTVILKRCFLEKWTKKRGSDMEEFTGHETQLFVNDVPCNQKEYQAKINEICPESSFRMITNTSYFTSMKMEAKRKMLLELSGSVTDEELAKGKTEFEELISNLTGKTIDEYRREIAAKKRKIKDEIDSIPARIDECKRSMPTAYDFDSITDEIRTKKESIAGIDRDIADRSNIMKKASELRADIYKKLDDAKSRRTERMQSILEVLQLDRHKATFHSNEIEQKIELNNQRIESYIREYSELEKSKEVLEKNRVALIEEWKLINGETLTFSDEAFICPTCKRSLDIEDIENKQSVLTANFNKDKAARISANVENGKAVKDKIAEISKRIDELNEEFKQLNCENAQLYAELDSVKCTLPNYEVDFSADDICKTLSASIADFEEQLNVPMKPIDISDLTDGKKILNESIEELTKQLANKDLIEKTKIRILELEKQHRHMSQELAGLEKTEFTIMEFRKAQIERAEERLNGLFFIVRWKLYEQQINGGEKEICEATVNGIPYDDLNTAMKINVGLDVINALCRHYGLTAPIFCDNRESVNELINCDSQIINLIVTKDKQLVID